MSTNEQYPAVFIISDLHVGAGKTDDCDLELEKSFIEFLKFLSSKNDKVELVINGDFLDFAQAPPWQGPEFRSESTDGIPLCSTERQSLAKLEAIHKAHKPIFDALRGYLSANGGSRLVILPGNHDADFFWPGVRERFIDLVEGSSVIGERLAFHLESAYHPPGLPKVGIEHGHQYDPCNWFKVSDVEYWSADAPPIFKDCDGEYRLLECVGTRFLNKFLNRLDEDYPFVDNVKPFGKFLEIFGMSAMQLGRGPLKAAIAIWCMLKFMSKSVVHHPDDLLKTDKSSELGVSHPLQLFVKEMTDDQRALLTKILQDNGFDIDCPLTMYIEKTEKAELCTKFLADHLDSLEDFREKNACLLSLGGSPGTLSLGKGFVLDETALLANAAKDLLETEALDTVIMGHTHVPVDRPKEISYINTGSWTRYYRFEEGDHPRPWYILKENSYELFPYELNYAELPSGSVSSAQSITFRERDYDEN